MFMSLPLDKDRRVFVGMPGYSHITGGAGRGFWRSTRLPERQVDYQQTEGSLLASNFNNLWVTALNYVHGGRRVDYFAMQHADIEPQDYWLDTLIEEMEERDLDVLGVVAPIKDSKGVTSIALARPDGDTWRVHCRLTMSEIFRLPLTFTSEDCGHPLLLNTGLWVCRFNESWAQNVHFTINDRIAFSEDTQAYYAQCEPEDWFFSRLCHEQGLKIGCTRKIKLNHRGEKNYPNYEIWGPPFDSAYVPESVLPEDGFRLPDINGWLTHAEGRELARLAEGKRVLEIGSYLGLSTVCLARTADSVVAVDPHDGRGTAVPQDTFMQFMGNLERCGVRNKVQCYVGTLEDGFVQFVNPDLAPYRLSGFDLAFIDGGHDAESVAEDIDSALKALKPDGLLAFHDYKSIDPDVTAAVDDLLSRGGSLVSLSDTLAVVRPPAEVPLEVCNV